MGEFLAPWYHAFAACALFEEPRTTDSLRHDGMGEFPAPWYYAFAACALFEEPRAPETLRPGLRPKIDRSGKVFA